MDTNHLKSLCVVLFTLLIAVLAWRYMPFTGAVLSAGATVLFYRWTGHLPCFTVKRLRCEIAMVAAALLFTLLITCFAWQLTVWASSIALGFVAAIVSVATVGIWILGWTGIVESFCDLESYCNKSHRWGLP